MPSSHASVERYRRADENERTTTAVRAVVIACAAAMRQAATGRHRT